MDQTGIYALVFIYSHKKQHEKSKEVHYTMQKNHQTNGALRSVIKKYQKSLAQVIGQLAQAVGNYPPEQVDIACFFQELIDGDWDAYEEATAHNSEELRKQDREILQMQEQIRQTLNEENQVLFDRYEDLLNCRMTSELDQAYLVGYQTAIRLLLMGILPADTLLTRDAQHAPEKGSENYET